MKKLAGVALLLLIPAMSCNYDLYKDDLFLDLYSAFIVSNTSTAYAPELRKAAFDLFPNENYSKLLNHMFNLEQLSRRIESDRKNEYVRFRFAIARKKFLEWVASKDFLEKAFKYSLISALLYPTINPIPIGLTMAYLDFYMNRGAIETLRGDIRNYVSEEEALYAQLNVAIKSLRNELDFFYSQKLSEIPGNVEINGESLGFDSAISEFNRSIGYLEQLVENRKALARSFENTCRSASNLRESEKICVFEIKIGNLSVEKVAPCFESLSPNKHVFGSEGVGYTRSIKFYEDALLAKGVFDRKKLLLIEHAFKLRNALWNFYRKASNLTEEREKEFEEKRLELLEKIEENRLLIDNYTSFLNASLQFISLSSGASGRVLLQNISSKALVKEVSGLELNKSIPLGERYRRATELMEELLYIEADLEKILDHLQELEEKLRARCYELMERTGETGYCQASGELTKRIEALLYHLSVLSSKEKVITYLVKNRLEEVDRFLSIFRFLKGIEKFEKEAKEVEKLIEENPAEAFLRVKELKSDLFDFIRLKTADRIESYKRKFVEMRNSLSAIGVDVNSMEILGHRLDDLIKAELSTTPELYAEVYRKGDEYVQILSKFFERYAEKFKVTEPELVSINFIDPPVSGSLATVSVKFLVNSSFPFSVLGKLDELEVRIPYSHLPLRPVNDRLEVISDLELKKVHKGSEYIRLIFNDVKEPFTLKLIYQVKIPEVNCFLVNESISPELFFRKYRCFSECSFGNIYYLFKNPAERLFSYSVPVIFSNSTHTMLRLPCGPSEFSVFGDVIDVIEENGSIKIINWLNKTVNLTVSSEIEPELPSSFVNGRHYFKILLKPGENRINAYGTGKKFICGKDFRVDGNCCEIFGDEQLISEYMELYSRLKQAGISEIPNPCELGLANAVKKARELLVYENRSEGKDEREFVYLNGYSAELGTARVSEVKEAAEKIVNYLRKYYCGPPLEGVERKVYLEIRKLYPFFPKPKKISSQLGICKPVFDAWERGEYEKVVELFKSEMKESERSVYLKKAENWKGSAENSIRNAEELLKASGFAGTFLKKYLEKAKEAYSNGDYISALYYAKYVELKAPKNLRIDLKLVALVLIATAAAYYQFAKNRGEEEDLL